MKGTEVAAPKAKPEESAKPRKSKGEGKGSKGGKSGGKGKRKSDVAQAPPAAVAEAGSTENVIPMATLLAARQAALKEAPSTECKFSVKAVEKPAEPAPSASEKKSAKVPARALAIDPLVGPAVANPLVAAGLLPGSPYGLPSPYGPAAIPSPVTPGPKAPPGSSGDAADTKDRKKNKKNKAEVPDPAASLTPEQLRVLQQQQYIAMMQEQYMQQQYYFAALAMQQKGAKGKGKGKGGGKAAKGGDGPGGKSKGDKKGKKPEGGSPEEIRETMTYYFSDQNLQTDDFLLTAMDKENGWVHLAMIASFNRMQKLRGTVASIAEYVKDNERLEVDGEGVRVRLRDPEVREMYMNYKPQRKGSQAKKTPDDGGLIAEIRKAVDKASFSSEEIFKKVSEGADEINIAHFREVLKHFEETAGIKATDDQEQAVWKVLDKNGDGGCDLSEFVATFGAGKAKASQPSEGTEQEAPAEGGAAKEADAAEGEAKQDGCMVM